jgi:hypothetical protein
MKNGSITSVDVAVACELRKQCSRLERCRHQLQAVVVDSEVHCDIDHLGDDDTVAEGQTSYCCSVCDIDICQGCMDRAVSASNSLDKIKLCTHPLAKITSSHALRVCDVGYGQDDIFPGDVSYRCNDCNIDFCGRCYGAGWLVSGLGSLALKAPSPLAALQGSIFGFAVTYAFAFLI